MIALIRFVLAILASPFKSKSRLEAENAVLRHQLRDAFFWSMTMSPSDPISSSLSLKKQLPISSDASSTATSFASKVHCAGATSAASVLANP